MFTEDEEETIFLSPQAYELDVVVALVKKLRWAKEKPGIIRFDNDDRWVSLKRLPEFEHDVPDDLVA